MTPEFKIKYCILAQYFLNEKEEEIDIHLTQDGVEELWDEYYDQIYDDGYISEFREGEVETNVPCEYSRHYESKAVAAQLPNGEWVGWTYWYGGGKHGEPEAVDWMNHAYNLRCKEEEKLVIVREFTKLETGNEN